MEQRNTILGNSWHVRAKFSKGMLVFMTAIYEEHVHFEGKYCLHCFLGIGTVYKPPGGIPDERLHLRVIRHPVDVHAGDGPGLLPRQLREMRRWSSRSWFPVREP